MTCLFEQVPRKAVSDEKIEAIRIRMREATHSTAVLAEFRAADRVLAGWLARSGTEISIDFQVTFCDGFVFCGCYHFRKLKRCRLSLTNHVRTSLEALKAEQPARLPDLSRYSVDS